MVAKSTSPVCKFRWRIVFGFRNKRCASKPEDFRPNLRLRQRAPNQAIGVSGRYCVGYHPAWFPTGPKNTGYQLTSVRTKERLGVRAEEWPQAVAKTPSPFQS